MVAHFPSPLEVYIASTLVTEDWEGILPSVKTFLSFRTFYLNVGLRAWLHGAQRTIIIPLCINIVFRSQCWKVVSQLLFLIFIVTVPKVTYRKERTEWEFALFTWKSGGMTGFPTEERKSKTAITTWSGEFNCRRERCSESIYGENKYQTFKKCRKYIILKNLW